MALQIDRLQSAFWQKKITQHRVQQQKAAAKAAVRVQQAVQML
jgi:hypothetical protein